MHIGAIISLTEDHQGDQISFGRRYSRNGNGFLASFGGGRLEILGRSLLDRAVANLRAIPSASVRIIPEGPASTGLLPARSAKPSEFITAWEDAVARHIREGAEQLLLLRIASYSDLDYEQLLRFHLQRGAALTQAYGPAGALDLAVVDAGSLRNAELPYRKALNSFIYEQERFFYDGYVNPLHQPHDLRRLVEDSLTGRCGLRPIAREAAPGIWMGAGAKVDLSVAVSGPVFVGAGAHVAEGCSITGSSSIERDCEIDCGTNVHESCVLQGVYVGVGLSLRRCLVSQRKFFHLDRNVAVEIKDERLIGKTKVASLARIAGFGYAE